jgi:hypothetical protein
MDMGLLSSRRYVCGVEDSNVCVRVCPDENQNKTSVLSGLLNSSLASKEMQLA